MILENTMMIMGMEIMRGKKINLSFREKNIFIIYKYIMYQNIVRQNKTLVSTIVFIISFGIIQFMQPSFLYNTDGSIREFGIGYKNKTILPIWLLSIVLGILSYLAVLYFLRF